MFLAGFSYELGLSFYWSIGIGLMPLIISLAVVGISIVWERRALPLEGKEGQQN